MNTEMDAFRALLKRAEAYYRETYHQTGYHPTRFRVTPHEEHLLKLYGGQELAIKYPPDWQAIYVMGMRVYLQERLRWDPACGAMFHYKGFGGRLPTSDELTPHEAATLEICETTLLMPGQRDIPCPCGDVIWVFAPNPWGRDAAYRCLRNSLADKCD